MSVKNPCPHCARLHLLSCQFPYFRDVVCIEQLPDDEHFPGTARAEAGSIVAAWKRLLKEPDKAVLARYMDLRRPVAASIPEPFARSVSTTRGRAAHLLATLVQKRLQTFTRVSHKIWLKFVNLGIKFFPGSVFPGSAVPDHPAPTQDHPSPTQDHPVPTQEHSTPTLHGLSQAQSGPGPRQGHPGPETNHAEALAGLVPLASDDDDSPKVYAIELIRWLRVRRLTRGIDHRRMIEEYVLMCAHYDWPLRPWNPVARQLTLLTTGGEKMFKHIDMQDGTTRRRRVYPIGGNIDKPRGDLKE